MIDTFGSATSESQGTGEFSKAMIEKVFAAAQPGTVFSVPVVSGDYTIITASEVVAAGGFGFGSGPTDESDSTTSSSGQARQLAGGGGGGSSGRPVAAIVIGPDGVKIEPVVDVTKIGLAAIGAWLSIALLLVRRARASK